MSRSVVPAAVVLADLLLAAAAHARLPERVPIHWGPDGQPDGWGPRAVLTLGGFALVAGVSALVVALRDRGALAPPLASDAALDDAARVSEAENAERGREARRRVEHTSLLLLVGIHATTLAAAAGALADVRTGLCAALAGFSLLAGNELSRLRPNRFAGVRTAATLASPQVWRRTHRVAGRALVASGVFSLGVLAFARGTAGYGAALAVFLVASLAPTLYARAISPRR